MRIRPFILFLLLPLASCLTVQYSFTGAPITAKTISISYFQNKATLVKATLSQTLTDAMIDKFVNNTKLELQQTDAELRLSGEVVDYSISPVAVQGNETAAKNRLTIKVNVRFTNTLDDKQSFEQVFTSYEDFDATVSLSQVEDDLTETIIKRIVEDTFNKALVNW